MRVGPPPPWCVWWSVMNAHTYAHPHSYPNQQPTDFSDFEDEEEDGFSDEEDLGKSVICFGLCCVVGAWGRAAPAATSEAYRRQSD